MFFRRLAVTLALWVVTVPLFAQPPAVRNLDSALVFEPNRGQAASSVRFVSHGNGHSFFLKETEAVLSFSNPSLTVRMTLVGQNPHPVIEGTGLQPGFTNYFHGNDPAKWLRSIPHFEKVKYSAVYPGIDLIYYGNGRQLEYDFQIQPSFDPSTIQIEFEGVNGVSLAPDGDLILSTPGGEIRHRRPIAFQKRGAVREPVEARFVVRDRRVGFKVGQYDHGRELTIDPTLVWSSYLGGTGADQGNDVAIDADGNVYVAGFTQDGALISEDEDPQVPALQPDPQKRFEGFVTKLSSSGTVFYSTYFGGTPPTSLSSQTIDDEAHSLALDSSGNIYVVGYTYNNDFPIVNGFQQQPRGAQEAYIVRLENSAGTLQFSSYLGGSQSDRAFGVAVDAVGNAYVAGSTLSQNFPVANAFQPLFGTGLRDAFLTKVTAAGTVAFSTYLGGVGDEQAYDVALDSAGEIILTGYTTSLNFPLSRPVFPNYRGGLDDIFITKFNSTGNALVFSTFWGGSNSDNGVRLAVDQNNTIYVTGTTASLDFSRKNPAQLFNAGGNDAFLIKMHSDGQDVDFATFIGAEDTDGGTGVAVDNNGFIYVTGFTRSLGFFAINAIGGFLRGVQDGFLMKLSPNASFVLYSTYVGGFGTEGATSIAADPAGNAYVTGFTTSLVDFPVSSNAFQPKNAGGQDGFIFKLNADDVKTSIPVDFPMNGGASTSTAGQTAQPVFGYASLEVAADASPSGLAIIDLRSAGTLLNEVTLPAPFPTPNGQVYVTTAVASATALTMVNRSDEDASITIYFTPNGGGGSVFEQTFTLPGHAQVSGFVYGEPFNIPIDQIGTLVYASTTPLSTIALRAGTGGAPVNVYLPIINLNRVNANPLTIPQFADGGGWSGQVYLVNPSDVPISGEIRFFKAGLPGEPGMPAEVVTDQATASVFTYNIEPHESFALATHSAAADITAAFVDVVPTSGSTAPLAYAILNFSENPLLGVTVEGVQAASEFKSYAEITGEYPEALGTMPALALANSLDTPATVTLKLINFFGTDSGLSSVITLPPKGHYSRFLNEVPGFENLPNPYQGILYATTSQPGVTFAGFRARYNEQGQFLITATGPLADVGEYGPVVFPHLVDGGGYATQFIVINGRGGSGAVGTLKYLNPSGNPLNLATLP